MSSRQSRKQACHSSASCYSSRFDHHIAVEIGLGLLFVITVCLAPVPSVLWHFATVNGRKACDMSKVSKFTRYQEEHLACKNWVMRCWCGYLSWARCRLFAYGPADATAFKPHNLMPHLNPDRFYLVGTGLPRLCPWFDFWFWRYIKNRIKGTLCPGACMGRLWLQLLLVLHLFNSLFSRTTWASQYQQGKTCLDLNEARDYGVWMQLHQLDHIVCFPTYAFFTFSYLSFPLRIDLLHFQARCHKRLLNL